MNISESLDKAADHIERYGHHKGAGFRDEWALTSPACAIGALSVATCGSMGHALAALHAYVGRSIPDWNDAPERTAEQVIETLRAAALIEAAKETDVRVVSPRVAVTA